MGNKITTADCKKFLVEIIHSNPEIINEIWGDKTTSMKEALDVKKWKRESNHCAYLIKRTYGVVND